ncbi:MFS transporter [Streptomyces nigra]
MSGRRTRRTAVTGIGVVAPNGLHAETYWKNVKDGTSVLDRVTREGCEHLPLRVAGEVRGFDATALIEETFLVQTDKFTHFALAAADAALQDAGLSPAAWTNAPYSVGVVTAAGSGGGEFGQRELQKLWGKGSRFVGPYQSIAWFYAASTGQISIRKGFKGPCSVVASDEAGGLDAVAHAARAVHRGTDVIVVGAAEAPLAPYSAVCQLGYPELGGRIGQGVGAALLSPAALSLVTSTFHGAERNKALGVWAAIGGTGSAAGVLLGGALTDGPGWPWVFFINVPVGLLLLVVLPAVIPVRAPQPVRLDVPGALLVTAGTASLIYGLVEAGDSGWTDPSTLLALAGAAAAYTVFAAVERASRAPLMDLRMFTRRPVLAGAFLMLIATALLISYFFLGSVYLQHIRGLSPLRTGLVFLPVAVATGIGAHLASRLVGTLGSRPTAVAGMALAATGTIPLTRLSQTGNVYAGLLPGFVIAALGIGAVLVTAMTTALAMVEPAESGLASGVVNTFHEVGGSIGVAVVSTVAASGFARGSAAGFRDAFTVCAVAAGAGAVVALGLVPRGKPRSTGGPHVH